MTPRNALVSFKILRKASRVDIESLWSTWDEVTPRRSKFALVNSWGRVSGQMENAQDYSRCVHSLSERPILSIKNSLMLF